MKFMFFSIKYSYSDILLKNYKLPSSCLFCCNHTCYCVNMVSVTSASHYITSASCYHLRFQSRSSMYIYGLIPWNFVELTEAVPIAITVYTGPLCRHFANHLQLKILKWEIVEILPVEGMK